MLNKLDYFYQNWSCLVEKIFNAMNVSGKMDGCFKTMSYKNINQAQVMLCVFY